ncbi:hypothetical protein DYBT9275_03645 [Dyadobacter sp. CECT 9275]|uniref:Late embryogenesis abundant protein LEA-2 subgroup domain-containing protein n=2 Tax=Dyadobacter helix TaxID=2822344 RepID=A0A916JGL1_9BACT|nr:hypothetical protein DYBT9275_03645 [Dyadobacter sp. CECT 9275]
MDVVIDTLYIALKLIKTMKKNIWIFVIFACTGFMTGCGVSKQVSDAKTFGDCKYDIASVDSVYLAGMDIREFRNIKSFSDLDLARYPRLGLAMLRKDIPLNLRVNLDITNPTKKRAAINQLEYKVLLTQNEIFSGFLSQLIEVMPGTGSTRVPVRLNANVYQLINNDQTRDEFINMVMSLTGKAGSKPSKLIVKVKPTLDIAGKQVNYPGYITFEKEITAEMVTGIK